MFCLGYKGRGSGIDRTVARRDVKQLVCVGMHREVPRDS